MGSHLSEHLDHVPWPGWPHVTPGVLGPTSPMALMKGAASLGGHRDHQTLGSGRKRGGAGDQGPHCPYHQDPHPARAALGSPTLLTHGWSEADDGGPPWRDPPTPGYALYSPWGVVRGSGGAQGSAPVALGTAVGEVTPCPIVPLLAHPGLAQGHSEGLLPLARPTTPGTALGCPKGQPQEQARGHWPPAARGADADTVPAWRLALGGTLGPIYAGDIGPVPPAELGNSGVLSCDTGIWEGAGLWQCGVTPSPCPAAAQAPEGTASMAPTILPAPTPSTLCTLHQPHHPLHPRSRVPPHSLHPSSTPTHSSMPP